MYRISFSIGARSYSKNKFSCDLYHLIIDEYIPLGVDCQWEQLEILDLDSADPHQDFDFLV